MFRRRLAILALGLAFAFVGHVWSQPAATNAVNLNGHVFRLPAGFTIELAAAPPLVDRPITINFDDDGRLYVSESSGSNENVNLQLAKKPHRILRMEDKNGDGVFDERTVFADNMMFPEGTLWYRGSLFVAAPPSIWKLTDTKNTGVADERVEWFKGKTLTGCANDLHGPYLGPDGWIYWGKGAFAEQTYQLPRQKKPFVTRAAHIFRCKPDGTGLEPVTTGGMDNPVDVAFTPGGEPIFTSTFVQYPAGGKRDGLMHAVHGGLYGKEFFDVLNPHIWTSPKLMPVLSHLGPAAPSGLTRYESRIFGPDYQDNFFACLFNLQKVTRHVLTPDGATFKSADSDFVVSDNKDFHPTDVIEDADGSLLIVDTGGWYKLCCPTSQLVKPDVLGAIYRVRKIDAPKIDDPRGRSIAWGKRPPADLAKLLDDPRPYVRRRAKESLADRGKDALPALEAVLRDGASNQAKREAVWTLVRIDEPQARKLVRSALAIDDDIVRQAAIHAVCRWDDYHADEHLMEVFTSGTPQNRRAAAEALGRVFRRESRSVGIPRKPGEQPTPLISLLLAALAQKNDHVLHHSLTHALIEMGDPIFPSDAVRYKSSAVRRSVLMANEYQTEAHPGWASVRDDLADPEAELRETAWWVVGRHPEWGNDLAKYLGQRLASKDLAAAERRDMIDRLAKSVRSPAIQNLIVDRLTSADVESQRLALAVMARANLRDPIARWQSALTVVLKAKNPAVLDEAVAAARAMRLTTKSPPDLVATLTDLGHDTSQSPLVRLNALAARPDGVSQMSPGLFAFLLDRAKSAEPQAQRSLAADVLSRARLSNEQLIALADVIPNASPLEVDRLLEPFTGCKDEAVGQRLLTALQSPNLKSVLRVDALKRRLKDFSPTIQDLANSLYAALDAEAGKQQARLETMLADLPTGDIRRGHEVFNRAKTACVACHAIGYLGGKTGPDLTRIGSIRTRRDLLEAIIFPSASLVRGYEPLHIVTHDGKSHNGLLQSETPDDLTLAIGPTETIRIPRRDIEEMNPSRVSLMPGGLDQQLSLQELADLVQFLQACK